MVEHENSKPGIYHRGKRDINGTGFFDNIVEWNGTYYKVGGKRLEVRDTKVENSNFYILTLAAVAKELNRRGMRDANVFLSVGLPLTEYSNASEPPFYRLRAT